MAYWGGYPEPMNDPEYDKNSDDVSFEDVLKALLALTIVAVIAFFVGGN